LTGDIIEPETGTSPSARAAAANAKVVWSHRIWMRFDLSLKWRNRHFLQVVSHGAPLFKPFLSVSIHQSLYFLDKKKV
jgi:hypothetical protein